MLWRSGSDPCTGWDGPAVLDPDGLAGDDAVARQQRAAEDIYSWSGATDVRVDTITGADMEDDFTLAADVGGIQVTRTDASTPSDRNLREAMCTAWFALRRDSWTDQQVANCAEGPARHRWREQIRSACGSSDVDRDDDTLFDAIRTNPPTQVDGHLVRMLGEATVYRSVPAAHHDLYSIETIGDALSLTPYVRAGGRGAPVGAGAHPFLEASERCPRRQAKPSTNSPPPR